MVRSEREPSRPTRKFVTLSRMSKTMKGSRILRFVALMVVGDKKGRVGFGLGKAAEVPETIHKGIKDTKKNMCTVVLPSTTVPHEVIDEFGAGRMLPKPAALGTGTTADGPAHAVMKAAGIRDIHAKCLRSNNPQNVVPVTPEDLKSPRGPEEVTYIRGKSVNEIVG